MWTKLPKDIKRVILFLLNACDAFSLMSTCKAFSCLISVKERVLLAYYFHNFKQITFCIQNKLYNLEKRNFLFHSTEILCINCFTVYNTRIAHKCLYLQLHQKRNYIWENLTTYKSCDLCEKNNTFAHFWSTFYLCDIQKHIKLSCIQCKRVVRLTKYITMGCISCGVLCVQCTVIKRG